MIPIVILIFFDFFIIDSIKNLIQPKNIIFTYSFGGEVVRPKYNRPKGGLELYSFGDCLRGRTLYSVIEHINICIIMLFLCLTRPVLPLYSCKKWMHLTVLAGKFLLLDLVVLPISCGMHLTVGENAGETSSSFLWSTSDQRQSTDQSRLETGGQPGSCLGLWIVLPARLNAKFL